MDIWAHIDPVKAGVLAGGLLIALWAWLRE
jgi:hypothetical protein